MILRGIEDGSSRYLDWSTLVSIKPVLDGLFGPA
jgi:hypothetical protein